MSSPYADFPEIDKDQPTIDTGPTDQQKYGSDTMSELCKILNGKILDNRRIIINSPWIWAGPITIQQLATAPPDIGIYPLVSGQSNLYIDPTSGRLVIRKFSGTVVELENIISVLQDLTNVQITSVANGDGIRYNSTTGKWENQPFPVGAGEINTASNVGTAGTGVFKQKTGVNLEFKKINAGSSKVTITNDVANSEVDVDVVESALTIANLTGNLTVARGGTGLATLTSGSYLKGAGTSNVSLQAAPIPVADGGTGKTSITSNALLKGAGTSAPTEITIGSSGDVLTVVSGAPAWQAPAGGGGGGTGWDATNLTDVKTGEFTGIDPLTGCSGLLEGRLVQGSGTFTSNLQTANGNYVSCTTGSTSGNTACLRSTGTPYNMNFNSICSVRFRMSLVGSNRMFCGFTSDISGDPANSTYLDSKEGVLMHLPQNGATWQIMCNNGSGTATLVDTGVTTVDNTIVNVVLKLVGATPKASYSVNGAAFTDITNTNDLPSSGTHLGLVFGTQVTSGVSRTLDLFRIKVQNDK